MNRRFFAAAAFSASAFVAVQAADTVTFVLTNGQRVSGDVASTSEASPAMPMGELNLEKAGADERSYGWEMVAVIEFESGRPSDEELVALPANGHLLALKDGTRHLGRLVSLRGDTLRWNGTSGRVEAYGLDRIARLYLDTGAARKAYNFTPPTAGVKPPVDPDPPVGRGRGRGADGAIQVFANSLWTDTGQSFKRGEVLNITVTGTIRFGRGESQTATAAGNDEVRNDRFPVPSLPVGALIGRIGNGPPFAIGASPTITVPATGRLLLGINDDGYGDNSGQFRVTVTRR